jgi:LCP family protein required for cell wall assembly
MSSNTRGNARALTGTPVRHGRQHQTHPVLRVARFLALAVSVVLVSAVSVAAIAGWQLLSSAPQSVHLAGQANQPPPPALGPHDGEVNLLLTASDTRTGQTGLQDKANLAASSGAGNNDSNILLHISQDHTNITVISFPRDLEIPIPACPSATGTRAATSQAMLNTADSRGGLSCVVSTIEKLTGLDIPYAATIKFNGVTAMSDAIGGVTVCLASPVIDKHTNPPLNLPAGYQTLVGSMAQSFLRTRYGVYSGGDLGRISNQQVFMSALFRKVQTDGVLQNPVKLYSLASAALHNITPTDTLANPVTLVSIALALKNVGAANTVFLQYPTVADPTDKNRVIPDVTAASILNAALVANKPVKLTGSTGVGATAPTPSPTPSTSTTGAPTPLAPSPSSAQDLPSSVTGQTAAEETCTKGNN